MWNQHTLGDSPRPDHLECAQCQCILREPLLCYPCVMRNNTTKRTYEIVTAHAQYSLF